jgi:hypothetical protein
MTEQPQPPAAPRQQRGISKIWVLVVLGFGILLGVLMTLTVRLDIMRAGPGQFFLLSIQRALQLHVILSTIEMVLLFSLVVVFLKIYSETRANFSMGILIVLFALLVHSILSFPLTVDDIGPVLLGSGAFFPYPDIFTIIAYTIFLYLSLG